MIRHFSLYRKVLKRLLHIENNGAKTKVFFPYFYMYISTSFTNLIMYTCLHMYSRVLYTKLQTNSALVQYTSTLILLSSITHSCSLFLQFGFMNEVLFVQFGSLLYRLQLLLVLLNLPLHFLLYKDKKKESVISDDLYIFTAKPKHRCIPQFLFTYSARVDSQNVSAPHVQGVHDIEIIN